MLLWIWRYKYLSLHFYIWDVGPEVGSLAHNSLVFNLLRKHLLLATLAAAVKARPVVLGFLVPGLTALGFSSVLSLLRAAPCPALHFLLIGEADF